MSGAIADPGSFRDPGGRVYHLGDKVLRTITELAAADFEFVQASGLIERLTADGRLIAGQLVSADRLGENGKHARFVVEHPRLPFISYPYEWPFPALKAAALLHLGIQLDALDAGVSLSDASAYNIQFQGVRPLFIDLLSFRRYHAGELWTGHRQFCEQFLNPLLLRSELGVAANSWYRGCQEGIGATDLRRLLPWRSKLSRNILLHVVAQSALQASSGSTDLTRSAVAESGLPLSSYRRMLTKLRDWIERLEPADTGKTVWRDYVTSHGYSEDEAAAKRSFIAGFVAAAKPKMLWDLGCNTGDYAELALAKGAGQVVGFDFDHGALEVAFARAAAGSLDFLPLFLDGANPSPDQGWAGLERKSLSARANADAVIALAYAHHLAIGRNIPLGDLLVWLTDLAPEGVVEFVPKQDPMVRRLLALRDDIFPDYREEYFLTRLGELCDIVQTQTITRSGRKLVHFRRRRN